MTHRSRLKFASLTFAALWTLWMIWCLSPLHPAQIGMLIVSGALAGLAWYWLYGWWYISRAACSHANARTDRRVPAPATRDKPELTRPCVANASVG
jgi:hypothetical protein